MTVIKSKKDFAYFSIGCAFIMGGLGYSIAYQFQKYQKQKHLTEWMNNDHHTAREQEIICNANLPENKLARLEREIIIAELEQGMFIPVETRQTENPIEKVYIGKIVHKNDTTKIIATTAHYETALKEQGKTITTDCLNMQTSALYVENNKMTGNPTIQSFISRTTKKDFKY